MSIPSHLHATGTIEESDVGVILSKDTLKFRSRDIHPDGSPTISPVSRSCM